MKEFPIAGSMAVITGAASGIGAALADALARRGAALALCDRDAAGLDRTVARAASHGVAVSAHVLDVADAGALAALPDAVIERHGRASILVNNAGVALAGTFEQTTLEDFSWLIDINLWAPVRLTKHFLPLLRRETRAHIVNLSSIFGVVAPPGQTAYAASKFGVRGFSEALRHELARSGIGLTVVHPGGVRTAIAENARRSARMSNAEVAEGIETARRFLVLDPSVAAACIADAIERRAPRLLIGGDARRLDIIQRLFPATYWARTQRYATRRAGGARVVGKTEEATGG